MYQTFYVPTKIISGCGSLRELPGEVMCFGKKAVIISDPGIEKAGILQRVEQVLSVAGIETAAYTGVRPNPTIDNASEAAALAKRCGAEVFVAVGGGSSIDTAKSASVLLYNPGPLSDYAGFDKFTHQPAPVIAIPTTAGTGSEVTKVAVMEDPALRRKFTVGSTRMMAKTALLDAELTLGLPPFITACTGMDALTHSLESYTSTMAQRVTDAINLDTICSVFTHLPAAVFRMDDREAREGMLYAACMASMTCNATFLGLVHAIASPVCALTDAPHGLACAVLLPEVAAYNLPAAAEKYARIAVAIGAAGPGQTRLEQAERTVAAIRRLARDIGIPDKLREIGVKEEHLDEIAQVAVDYPQAKTNCRRAAQEEIRQILVNIF